MGNLKEFTKGLLKENPTLVGLLGMCPTLAVTTQAVNGLGMGLATTFVLVGSNLVISLLRNVIPKSVKLPCYIVIIAGFVTLIDFLMHGFVPDLHSALGTFLSLITVNCIILGRAEMFACKTRYCPPFWMVWAWDWASPVPCSPWVPSGRSWVPAPGWDSRSPWTFSP